MPKQEGQGGPPQNGKGLRTTPVLERGIRTIEDLFEYTDAALLDQDEGAAATSAVKNHLKNAQLKISAALAQLRYQHQTGKVETLPLFPRRRAA